MSNVTIDSWHDIAGLVREYGRIRAGIPQGEQSLFHDPFYVVPGNTASCWRNFTAGIGHGSPFNGGVADFAAGAITAANMNPMSFQVQPGIIGRWVMGFRFALDGDPGANPINFGMLDGTSANVIGVGYTGAGGFFQLWDGDAAAASTDAASLGVAVDQAWHTVLAWSAAEQVGGKAKVYGQMDGGAIVNITAAKFGASFGTPRLAAVLTRFFIDDALYLAGGN